jgi:hypothetical protein
MARFQAATPIHSHLLWERRFALSSQSSPLASYPLCDTSSRTQRIQPRVKNLKASNSREMPLRQPACE